MRAMILAAGRGVRMRPLTDHTPKPLLCAGGKPLIVWHVERLADAGFCDIVINAAWLGEKIVAYLGNGNRYGVRLHYSMEDTPLETAGGIARALPLLGDAPFLVVNGDVWCDWNPACARVAAQRLRQRDWLAWLYLVNNPDHHPHGDFVLHADQRLDTPPPVSAAQATPTSTSTSTTSTFTFSGTGVYHPMLFADVPPGQPAKLATLLHHAIAHGRAGGQHYAGTWVDVGTPERLQALDDILTQRGIPPGKTESARAGSGIRG